ncbi:MAG: ABC transporter ATP-binding protein [Polyangiaceae bacterium]|nr:ABC transporter ATP-binding protein [Polyangiaceae bacterium]
MATDDAIRLNSVTKRFGAKLALDDVTLAAPRGAIFGLIGPNGAGKTTSFSLLAGYLRPSSGDVTVLGRAPTDVDALRGRLGVLPQDAQLPAGDTVGEFLVHMGRLQDMSPERARGAARNALAEVAGSDWWSERCGGLSHGMAKRVAIAQAFLGDPELVLLDEPTAGLDPRVAWEVRQVVRAKRGRCAVIVSSHNLRELEEVCDAAAILDHGRIATSGPLAELTAEHEEIRVRVAPGASGAVSPGELPLDALAGLPLVRIARFDESRLEIVVGFDGQKVAPEDVIAQVLRVLLDANVKISGLSKGRGLEQRVIQMT